MANFFSQLAGNVGRVAEYNQQYEGNQALIEDRQQRVAMGKMDLMQKRKEVDAQEAVSGYLKTQKETQAEAVDDPMRNVKMYQSAAKLALENGSPGMAKELTLQAKGESDRAKEARADAALREGAAQEGLAKAALGFQNEKTPESYAKLKQAALAAGEAPPPEMSDVGLAGYVGAKSLAGTKSEGIVKARESIREFDAKQEENKRNHEDVVQQRREAAADRASAQQQSLALRQVLAQSAAAARSDRTADKVSKTDFIQSEKLNTVMQKEAASYLKDREVISSVKNLLSVNSPVSDQQVRQALPALLGNLKGRATNPYYQDNKNYGGLVNKVSGVLSRAFTGRYSEGDRKEISSMLNQMETVAIDPALTRIESDQKAKARKYGLDPDNIELKGDFNRTAPTPAGGTSGGTSRSASGKVTNATPPDVQSLLNKYK